MDQCKVIELLGQANGGDRRQFSNKRLDASERSTPMMNNG